MPYRPPKANAKGAKGNSASLPQAVKRRNNASRKAKGLSRKH